MEMKELRIDQIRPNPLQPREIFDKEKLKELAATIADVGVLQPILVRPTKNNHYEIIAGERRWKATQIAGIDTIPALIKPLPDSQVMIESLIENAHRENLKPIEQAKAILEVFRASESSTARSMIDDRLPQKISKIHEKRHGRYVGNELTEEETILDSIVHKIGISPISVYRSLKLLSLPESIQIEATEKGIDKKHLTHISAIETEQDQREVFDVVVEKELSSRDTAALSKVVRSAPEPVKHAVLDATVPVEVAQTIIDTKRSDAEQEAMVNIAIDKHLSKEDTEHLVRVVERAPEPVKRAVLDAVLDAEVAEEILAAFEDLPDDGLEQVTQEAVKLQPHGKEYVKEHIQIRKKQAEGTALPDTQTVDIEGTIAKSYIEKYNTVHDTLAERILHMPKVHQDRCVLALLSAHGYLEKQIQILRKKGLLTQEEIGEHRAKYAIGV